jgi:hypothetical protein
LTNEQPPNDLRPRDTISPRAASRRTTMLPLIALVLTIGGLATIWVGRHIRQTTLDDLVGVGQGSTSTVTRSRPARLLLNMS